MKSNFNSLCFDVLPQDVLGGKREETEEYSFSSMELEVTGARTRGTNPNVTTKCTHGAKVGFDTSAENVRRAGKMMLGLTKLFGHGSAHVNGKVLKELLIIE